MNFTPRWEHPGWQRAMTEAISCHDRRMMQELRNVQRRDEERLAYERSRGYHGYAHDRMFIDDPRCPPITPAAKKSTKPKTSKLLLLT